MSMANIYNLRRVDERLVTSGQPTEAQLADVAADGGEVVINLALHDDPRYSLANERGTVESLGMRYIHIPVQFANPTEADLRAFFEAMDDVGQQKVLVHCAANYRATAFLGLYRLMRQGMTDAEAFAPMRTVWEPTGVWAQFISEAIARKIADRV
jgi:uncharacterized protein (TIGR01244 family)